LSQQERRFPSNPSDSPLQIAPPPPLPDRRPGFFFFLEKRFSSSCRRFLVVLTIFLSFFQTLLLSVEIGEIPRRWRTYFFSVLNSLLPVAFDFRFTVRFIYRLNFPIFLTIQNISGTEIFQVRSEFVILSLQISRQIFLRLVCGYVPRVTSYSDRRASSFFIKEIAERWGIPPTLLPADLLNYAYDPLDFAAPPPLPRDEIAVPPSFGFRVFPTLRFLSYF